MENSIIRVENLSVCYNDDKEGIRAVNDVSFNLDKGSSLGIIGESGSGKTSIAMALMGLLKKSVTIDGKVYYGNTDLNSLLQKDLKPYRWAKIAIVFQNSLDVLNPVLTVHEQILECIQRHIGITGQQAHKKVVQLLEMVGLDSLRSTYYPHQLSGGMRQRVLIAMALSCDPQVLIIDEPTTALDSVAKDEITGLLARLHREKKFAMLVISHDMQIVSKLTNRLLVTYLGHIVEEGLTKDILKNPMHTYTRGLINASPHINPYGDLWGIPGEAGTNRPGGCPFYDRCNQSLQECKIKLPKLQYVSIERKVACNRGGILLLLKATGINKSFIFKGKTVRACDECDINIYSGEVVALIGESGSGKTTLASILSGTMQAEGGEVDFEGQTVRGNNTTSRKSAMQIVFQDPFTATNEHLTIEQTIREPLDILKLGTREQRIDIIKRYLKDVQLPCDEGFMKRKCYSLSGGQRQRVAVARSLVMEPKILIADEISSMLDPSTQANLLRLLKGLQNSKGFAMIFITHDIALARKIADRIYIMNKGRIVEQGSVVSDESQENYK